MYPLYARGANHDYHLMWGCPELALSPDPAIQDSQFMNQQLPPTLRIGSAFSICLKDFSTEKQTMFPEPNGKCTVDYM